MTRRAATFTGFTAVLLWALLALFTVGSAPVPPLLLNALTFTIGGIIGLGWVTVTRGWHRLARVPLWVYGFGTLGLFGYHALYFSALRLAPPAEAGLIAYLWPLLIVLFSGFLPGERLGVLHVLGALAAFAGAALIVLRGAGASFDASTLPGLGLALLCALTWSSYSVLSRRLGRFPTEVVAVYCVATAAYCPSSPMPSSRRPRGPTACCPGPPSGRWASARWGWPSIPGTSGSSAATSSCWAPQAMPRRCCPRWR
jgi:drug/metabolite transporter (DMT)-like permease